MTRAASATKRSAMAWSSLTSALDAPLSRMAARAAALGASGTALLAAGFVLGLLAVPAIGFGRFWIGLALVAVGRAAALVGRAQAPELAARLAAIFFASLPFAFALADPTRALAATFALFGFVAFLALRRLDVTVELIGNLAFAIACAVPGAFSLVAYALGIASFVAVGIALARDAA